MGKLQINGDLLLAGNLMMSTSNVSAYSVISVKPDSNAYGQNLIIGAGGNTVIGGGESASAFFTASGIKDEENLYLTADDSVHIYTNCDPIANRKLVMSMGADGNITTSGTIITPGNDSVVIKPAKNNYDQIGASDCKFWKIHATTFYGNLSGNADTATTASAVAWGNVTDKPSSFTPSSHSHSYIDYVDTRSNNQSPNDLQAGLTIHLKANSTDGLSDGGNYHAVVGIKDWGDYSGGPYGQLAITENHMWFRNSSSGTAWNSWRKLLDSSNYTSYTVTKTGSGASGTWGINVTGTANYAYYLNTVAGNEIRIHNATGLTAGGSLWLGWAWADGNKTVTKDWYIGNFSGGGLANIYAANFIGAWQGNSPSAFAPASHSHSYVPISGGTMTGKLQVNNIIFGYNYTNSNNAAAFMFDKPGSNYTGIGANGSDSTIKFGPCNANGTWVNGFAQHWTFQGTIRPGCIILTNDQWTGYGTGDPDELGLDKVVGRLYFRI